MKRDCSNRCTYFASNNLYSLVWMICLICPTVQCTVANYNLRLSKPWRPNASMIAFLSVLYQTTMFWVDKYQNIYKCIRNVFRLMKIFFINIMKMANAEINQHSVFKWHACLVSEINEPGEMNIPSNEDTEVIVTSAPQSHCQCCTQKIWLDNLKSYKLNQSAHKMLLCKINPSK